MSFRDDVMAPARLTSMSQASVRRIARQRPALEHVAEQVSQLGAVSQSFACGFSAAKIARYSAH